MNTPNNAAAAVERLEHKWRDKAREHARHGIEAGYAVSGTYTECADELAALRATLDQPDALTSQPSGDLQPQGHNDNGKGRDNQRQPQGTTSGGSPDYSRPSHPSSDAPKPEGEL